MADYKVQLKVFEGPLDLLLYLIKKEEMDIYNIPIAQITTQYMQYLDLMKIVIPDVAGEFVVMGATLMYIKSKMLLPEDQQVSDPEHNLDELDPRWDLIRQLVEYKKFKEAAEHLQQRESFQENVYPRHPTPPVFEAVAEDGSSLGGVGIFDLLGAFNKILERIQQTKNLHEITEDHFTVTDKINFILERIASEERIAFAKLFEGIASRGEIIVTFLAVLELIRLKQLRVDQEEAFGEIILVSLKQKSAPPLPATTQT